MLVTLQKFILPLALVTSFYCLELHAAEITSEVDDSLRVTNVKSAAVSAAPIDIKYNIHESISSEWTTEFNVIMGNLLAIIPAKKNVFDTLNVYAWNGKVEDPFAGVNGGAYVGGPPSDKIMVLEIPENEFLFQDMHRYSVIAHEYFHVYQLSLNKPMNRPNGTFDPDGFDIKWLIEGTAAYFESVYIQEYYKDDYLGNSQANINEKVHSNPSVYESYGSNGPDDRNYGSSVFITLALAKELISKGFTEEVAFRMIYKDFMLTGATNTNWKSHFFDVFGIAVDDF